MFGVRLKSSGWKFFTVSTAVELEQENMGILYCLEIPVTASAMALGRRGYEHVDFGVGELASFLHSDVGLRLVVAHLENDFTAEGSTGLVQTLDSQLCAVNAVLADRGDAAGLARRHADPDRVRG